MVYSSKILVILLYPMILLLCMIIGLQVKRYRLNVESSDQDQNIPLLTKLNIKSKW